MPRLATRFRLTFLAALTAPLIALAAPDDAPGLPPYPALRHSDSDMSRIISAAIPLGDGNVLLAGRIFDAMGPASWGWLARTDGKGARIWDKELGKKARNASFAAASAAAGGAVLVGSVNEDVGALGHAYAWIVAVAADGRVQWDKALTFGQITRATQVEPTQNGAVLVLGTVRHPGNKGDQTWIVRIDGAGRVALEQTLDVPRDFVPHALAALGDGSFLAAGQVLANAKRQERGWVGQFGSDGKPLWSRMLDKEDSNIVAVRTAQDGSIVLAVNSGRDSPFSLMRLNAAGTVVQAPQKTGLCDLPTLWRQPGGQLRVAGLGCAPAQGPSFVGLITDPAHPERMQRLGAVPGADVTQLVPLDEHKALGVLGSRAEGEKTISVFAVRPLP